ncbi:MAG: ParB/RepB/Spo0J family partition protein [Bacilli bacterium]|nr:ParB/RepB/Spo0J family partition protein [Bacilli bacterium]MBQ6404635.1 ParB/RepB/Spo0J family partition protein [Bacilli bacterium]
MYPDTKDEVVQLYLDDIIPNRFQPREVFDEKALKELAVSIKEHGVIQPIIVRSVNGKYEIIAGERRYKASALAGLTKIPAIVRDLDDKESSKVALLENLQRKNLNPIEEAKTYQKILEIDQMTQEELARTMGKSQSAVANKLRLLSLPDEIQEYLLKEELSERHARALLNLDDAEKQKEMAKKVIDNKMSVRNLEAEIKEMTGKTKPKQEEASEKPEVIASTKAFVNDNPLIPTAKVEEDKSNYGKVTIAPPEGEEMPSSKFINYGEIDKEEEKTPMPIPNVITSIDVNDVKENTNDIKSGESSNSGNALDSLLNLGNPTSSIPANEFITPAEKIVKTDSLEDPAEDTSSEYFNTSDLSNIELPPSIINPSEEENTGTYSIEEAVEKIKNTIEDLKKHGINLNADEMDFEKSYQMIIKIEK